MARGFGFTISYARNADNKFMNDVQFTEEMDQIELWKRKKSSRL